MNRKSIYNMIYQVMNSAVKARKLIDYFVDITHNTNDIINIYIIGSQSNNKKILSMLRKDIENQLIKSNILRSVNILFYEISNLPLSLNGLVNTQQLQNLSTIKEESIQKLEHAISEIKAIKQFALFSFSDKPDNNIPLHINNIYMPRKNKQIHSAELIKKTAMIDIPSDNSSYKAAYSRGDKIFNCLTSKTLYEALQNTIKRYPNQGIRYIEKDQSVAFQTYSDLYHNALKILAGLNEIGLKKGAHIILQLQSMQEFFITFWACILGGIIPLSVAIPIHSNTNDSTFKLTDSIQLLNNPTIICSEDLISSHEMIINELGNREIKLVSINTLLQSNQSPSLYIPNREEVLFHQLTSGSTASSKCVQITHKGVISHVKAIAQFNRYCSEDISLNWLPLDHVAPILMCHLKDLCLGIESIMVHTEIILASPLNWLDYLDKYHVSHSWSPNFGFKLVNQELQKKSLKSWKLQHVKELMNAGEQVSLDVIETFIKLTKPFGIQENVIQPAYGMAETCTAITYQNNFSLTNPSLFHHAENKGKKNKLSKSIFVDLGSPIPEVEISIVDPQGNLLTEGEIGQLQVRGDVVTPGYLNAAHINESVFSSDGWFKTGDIGFIKQGSLTLTGREKEVIIIQGVNYYCYDIEAMIEKVVGVVATYVAACGVFDSINDGESLVIFFVQGTNLPPLDIQIILNIRKKLSESIGVSPTYIIPLSKDNFPKTTSGKIKRNKLKMDFEKGCYEDICKEIDILLKNDNTLPHWFYQSHWHRKQGNILSESLTREVLCFTGSNPFANKCFQFLQKEQYKMLIRVDPGSSFSRINPKHFILNPNCIEHYIELFKLVTQEFNVQYIIYLWASEESLAKPIQNSIQALLMLNQVIKEYFNQALELIVLDQHSQQILPNDCAIPEKSLLISICKTIAQENPDIEVKHIDLDDHSISSLKNELDIKISATEIAYRNNNRYCHYLKQINFATINNNNDPIVIGGTYLITGGMGGVGLELSKFLLNQYQTKLIIIGNKDFQSVLESESFQMLNRIGPQCIYRSADICDINQLQYALKTGLELLETSLLDGIFHLAGKYHDCSLNQETIDSFENITNSKIYGSINLANLLQQYNPSGLFVSFSTVYTFFNNAMTGAYVAGNRFLEEFNKQLRRKTSLKSFCFAWSQWDDLGMSKGYQSFKSRGYDNISPKRGFISMCAALYNNIHFAYIGLNHNINNISSACLQPALIREQLHCVYTTEDSKTAHQQLQNISLESKAGAIQCNWHRVQAIPVDVNGNPDESKIISTLLSYLNKDIKPRSSIESRLLSIWKNVLENENICIKDNFFEVGGDSISLIRLLNLISEEFKRPFDITEFFKYPSISSMALYLQNTEKNLIPNRAQYLEKRKRLQSNRRRLITSK